MVAISKNKICSQLNAIGLCTIDQPDNRYDHRIRMKIQLITSKLKSVCKITD